MNGPSGDWPDELDERYRTGVITVSGLTVTVDFLIRPEAVEIWFQARRRAILNRHELRCWLAEPYLPLVVGGVALTLEPDSSGWTALSRSDLLVWTVPPDSLAGLQYRI